MLRVGMQFWTLCVRFEYAAWRRSVTRSVTHGIPTLEREERYAFGRAPIVPMLRVGMQFWTLCVRF
ncbi:hypothetical protein AL057_05295 [Pseudomonas amygdali pv. myricae]|nr:hypothetical protein AL057_05295 [Pseudomonas amygdali pv. myricae]